MVISNDVFGLTISQFERMYKACLERRKTKEQYILNLRYPDKSSNEYLEYLKNCTDSYKDHLLLVDPKETYLYEQLVKIVGTEIEIRMRQRLFIIQDMLVNSYLVDREQISSGSLAKGLDLPGSDVDTMFVFNMIEAVQNARNIKHPIKRDIFELETDINHPGFTRLIFVANSDRKSCFKVMPKLCYCFSLCLDKLISWVNNCYCPNYFIPEHNMFLGKINQCNNKTLLRVLESINYGGIDGILMNLFPADNANPGLLITKSESSCIMLHFLFYQIADMNKLVLRPVDISDCHKYLSFTESLLMSESSPFIISVCKYNYAKISQIVSQLLPQPKPISKAYNIRSGLHRHLQNDTKYDAVSGWLLYASFYYVTGQFNVTLRLTDYVLSRCSPDMMRENDYDCKLHRNCYRRNVHFTMTFIERIKMAIVNYVLYIKNSLLIPEELQLEVEDGELIIPPLVMCHCLRFLCYHHLCDLFNRHQALRDLNLTVIDKYSISGLVSGQSLVIVGVCHEISGDKDRTYQCYGKALQCGDLTLSSSAKKRISKLDGSLCDT